MKDRQDSSSTAVESTAGDATATNQDEANKQAANNQATANQATANQTAANKQKQIQDEKAQLQRISDQAYFLSIGKYRWHRIDQHDPEERRGLEALDLATQNPAALMAFSTVVPHQAGRFLKDGLYEVSHIPGGVGFNILVKSGRAYTIPRLMLSKDFYKEMKKKHPELKSPEEAFKMAYGELINIAKGGRGKDSIGIDLNPEGYKEKDDIKRGLQELKLCMEKVSEEGHVMHLTENTVGFVMTHYPHLIIDKTKEWQQRVQEGKVKPGQEPTLEDLGLYGYRDYMNSKKRNDFALSRKNVFEEYAKQVKAKTAAGPVLTEEKDKKAYIASLESGLKEDDKKLDAYAKELERLNDRYTELEAKMQELERYNSEMDAAIQQATPQREEEMLMQAGKLDEAKIQEIHERFERLKKVQEFNKEEYDRFANALNAEMDAIKSRKEVVEEAIKDGVKKDPQVLETELNEKKTELEKVEEELREIGTELGNMNIEDIEKVTKEINNMKTSQQRDAELLKNLDEEIKKIGDSDPVKSNQLLERRSKFISDNDKNNEVMAKLEAKEQKYQNLMARQSPLVDKQKELQPKVKKLTDEHAKYKKLDTKVKDIKQKNMMANMDTRKQEIEKVQKKSDIRQADLESRLTQVDKSREHKRAMR